MSERPHRLLARMVDRLVEDGCIRTLGVERAFRTIQRHRFLPEVDEETVYAGEAIPIKQDERGLATSSSSEPAIMAVMIEQLSLERGGRALEVGTGSGYNAALLAELVGPDGHVSTIDLDVDLVVAARRALVRAGFTRVTALVGDGWEGAAEQAPFDRIEVTVGVWDLSPRWMEQLGEGGVIVAPLWLRAGVQASVAFRKHGDRLVSESVRPCGFMRLRGPNAGPEALVTVDGWVACVDQLRPTDIQTLRGLRHRGARRGDPGSSRGMVRAARPRGASRDPPAHLRGALAGRGWALLRRGGEPCRGRGIVPGGLRRRPGARTGP